MLKKLLISIVSTAILIAAGLGLWLWQGLETLEKPVVLNEPILFEVPAGAAFSHVARTLEQDGLVDKSLWLRIYGRLYPDQVRIKAGEYEITNGMTALSIIGAMVAGDTKHWSIQFIEGWTFSDMRAALAQADHLNKVTTDWTADEIMKALGAEGEHPEGRFFPDTYLYSGNESDLDILKRTYEKMNNLLEEEWAGREQNLPYDSPYEALIMASIVERETGAPQERDRVAGVFVRRLKKGMRLQTDPTVIYGMGDKYKGKIRSRDLRTYTPYNTYRIDGLPPTPIALPGRDSIYAALHPDDGKALYFVARGDGTHKFSDTLAEHQKAVREYQLNRREDYRSSPAIQSDTDNPDGSAS